MQHPGTSLREMSDSRPGRTAVAGLYLLLFCLALIPIFAFEVLPLGDMPNHLARTYILNHLDANPVLQKYYATHWELFSFQSTDILLPLLAGWFGLSLGQHLFVAITFALLL